MVAINQNVNWELLWLAHDYLILGFARSFQSFGNLDTCVAAFLHKKEPSICSALMQNICSWRIMIL